MRLRRRLPPDLRDALRAAERAGGARLSRRAARRLLRVPMAGWFLLLFAAVLVVGESGLRAHLPGWAQIAPWPTLQTALPRVIYGRPEASAPSAIPASGSFVGPAHALDGDTLAAGGDRLRIHGIDAPEAGQSCERAGRTYACGDAATRAMAALLGSGAVSCQVLDTDRYGRRVARCRNAQGLDIGGELVRQGWAVAFTRYAADYLAQEREARAARRGLWAGRFEAPAEWRAQHRP